jgi:rubrerythrin
MKCKICNKENTTNNMILVDASCLGEIEGQRDCYKNMYKNITNNWTHQCPKCDYAWHGKNQSQFCPECTTLTKSNLK